MATALTRAVKKYQEQQGIVARTYKLRLKDTDAFKKACEKNGESQAGVLTGMMAAYVNGDKVHLIDKNEQLGLENKVHLIGSNAENDERIVELTRQLATVTEELEKLKQQSIAKSDKSTFPKIQPITKIKCAFCPTVNEVTDDHFVCTGCERLQYVTPSEGYEDDPDETENELDIADAAPPTSPIGTEAVIRQSAQQKTKLSRNEAKEILLDNREVFKGLTELKLIAEKVKEISGVNNDRIRDTVSRAWDDLFKKGSLPSQPWKKKIPPLT
jgi:uncharacterized protein YfbU (UPF0304 family)